jgi:hypothetical protein
MLLIVRFHLPVNISSFGTSILVHNIKYNCYSNWMNLTNASHCIQPFHDSQSPEAEKYDHESCVTGEQGCLFEWDKQ